MAEYKKADRPLTVTTPLGPDDLLLKGFTGREAISQLFRFQLDLFAENKTDVSFDKVLGQKVTVHVLMPGGAKRHINGLCNRFAQGDRDATFTSYTAEIVPDFWKATRKAQSRIFQHMTVPDILKKVLAPFGETTYELQGTFNERNFCVQYRESDFNFACRLMEEEGIYWFFKHSDGSHKMVVANTPESHSDVPGKTKITYEDIDTGFRDDDRVVEWEKVQELRSGKYTLWDHCFELPHKHLEADKTILDTVSLGKASHKLKLGGNDAWELYDWPGEYAQRYDGVDKGGGDRPADIQKIFDDNKRTVAIRMQQEALGSLVIRGRSNCPQMESGHKFNLAKHFSGEGGPYVLTSVGHASTAVGDYRAGFTGDYRYENQFECIPVGLPFRTPQRTPKPVVQGSQSAVVVGPPGEEIFTDKYGRVKVQFHWDREGKNNQDSSCWLRVSTLWAGKQWGMIHTPRIGQEVLVDFLEGDPDQPIVIGSVYNADMMPPSSPLPEHKTASGIRTRSTLGGDPETYNEITFEDKKGAEVLYIRAEKDHVVAVEHDEYDWNGHDHWNTVDNDEKTEIGCNRTESVGGDETVTIGNSRTVTVNKSDDTHHIKMGKREVKIDMGDDKLTVSMGNQTTDISLGKSETTAMQSIELKVGQSSVKLDQTGVTIKGMMISIEGQITTNVKGMMTTVEGQVMTDVKAVMTTLEGQAITQVKGAITQVNGDGILMAHGGITLIG